MEILPTLVLALMAGLSIPAGALVSSNARLRSLCLRLEIDSFVSYFGGGALMAAIALVLIPHGANHTSTVLAAVSFLLGGVTFWALTRWVKARGGAAAQFMAMLLDFIPEAVALGAISAAQPDMAVLLAMLIAIQNMPEGFASHHEMRAAGMSRSRLWQIFLAVPLAGPIAAYIGIAWLVGSSEYLALLMLFSSGGILYLIFDEIAPGAHLEHRDFPALGSVAGFLFGMLGWLMIH